MKDLSKLTRELFFGSLLFFSITERAVHLYSSYQELAPHQNQLCLGECFTAKYPASKTVTVDWELSTDLDHSTRENVYNLRKRRIEERQELLNGSYQPTRSIYSNIVDYLRWWGFDGYYRHLRSGNRPALSSAGKSLRGEEILNPFNLITVKPRSLTVENPEFNWKVSAPASAEGGPCPYFPEKSAVRWTPGERRADITYEVSEFAKKLARNKCVEKAVGAEQIELDIDPVNAQDLGLPFLAYSFVDSTNISFGELSPKIYRLNFFYHRGTSCAHPDGCNNISPLVPDFSKGEVKATTLPATIVFNLWENEPASVDATPDFQYWVYLR